jgi:hypothetical protein
MRALEDDIQSDAPRLASFLNGPNTERAVAWMGKTLLGNATATVEDVARAAQNSDRMKIAAAEKDLQQALSQDGGAPLGDVADSSPSSSEAPKLTVKGIENGLHRRMIAQDLTNQVLAYLVTVAFFALIVLLMFSSAIMPKAAIDGGVRDLLFTLLGVVATGWANIIGFYFGSSAGSAQKSQTISSALLRRNPAESPSAS